MRHSPLIVKLASSVAVVGAASGVASLGTFAGFTSSTPAQSQAFSSGVVSIALGSTNRLTVGASDLVPGDTVERVVDLANEGTADNSQVGAITLTTTASPSSLLDSDTTDGLQMTIDDCSAAWTESGPPYTYSCGGTTSTVLASRPVIGSDLALSNLSALAGGGTDHLRITLTLPASAGNALQGQSSTIAYAFTAAQRTAASR